MSDVFISYKSDDAARVIRLVRALETAGLSVWWDRSLAAGENWRSQIQCALDAAKCVIVVWTHESVGPAGDFVRDEAGHAKSRGVLVPVKLSKVNPPMGFGEIQAIDLTRWKGSSRDPFFQDLLAAVRAKIEGRNVPPGVGPTKRLRRRLRYGSLASALLFCFGAFASNTFQVQDRACRLALFQPLISDACGALELGNRPTKSERTAWESRSGGSCAALRSHIERFPNGFYRGEANGLLTARRVTQTEIWTDAERRLSLFQPESEAASSNKVIAQDAAMAEAQRRAERLCRGFEATTSFHFKSAKPAAQEWKCTPTSKGVTCGFEGEAVCELEERRIEEHETCGK
jgi:hypothetical protein